MKISTFGLSDRGKVREQNEDMLLMDDHRRIYAVADGMGGLPEGALASKIAIHALDQAIANLKDTDFPDFKEIFNAISQKVYQRGQKVDKKIGIGTTLTVLKLIESRISIGHVGDCAAFLFRDQTWKQITTDHTLAVSIRSQLGPDEEIELPDYFNHTLTRCIGQEESVKTDIYHQTLEPGDRLLICSDGITNTQSEEELLGEALRAGTAETFIQQIIAMANKRGGPDNSTAIALFID